MKEVRSKNRFKDRDEIDTYFSDAKKKNFPLGLIIVLIILTVVGIVAYYYYIIDSPKNIFYVAFNNITKNIEIDYTEYKTGNIDYQLDMDFISNNEEYKAIANILNEISITGNSGVDFENHTTYLHINALYEQKDLLSFDSYFKDKFMLIKLNNIYDKVIKYELSEEDKSIMDSIYEMSDMSLSEKVINSLKSTINKTLKNADYIKEYIKADEKYIKKITLSITKELSEYFYNQLLENKEFLDSYSKIENISKKDLIEKINQYKLELTDDITNISLYLSIFSNKLIKLEMINDIDRIVLTKENNDYNYKIYEDSIIMYEGSIFIENNNKELKLNLMLEDIEEQLIINIDFNSKIEYNKEVASLDIDKSINYESLTEADINKMSTNISKNETLKKMLEDIILLYSENIVDRTTQTT